MESLSFETSNMVKSNQDCDVCGVRHTGQRNKTEKYHMTLIFWLKNTTFPPWEATVGNLFSEKIIKATYPSTE